MTGMALTAEVLAGPEDAVQDGEAWTTEVLAIGAILDGRVALATLRRWPLQLSRRRR